MPPIFNPDLRTRQPLASSLLEAAARESRLFHAYLLAGRNLEDKWEIARQLAAFLNCESQGKEHSSACLLANSEPSCRNCRWIAAGEHPQAWIVLAGEKTASGKISVEKARLVAQELAKTSSFHRFVVVSDASQEIFHRPAANALLKTIEEPGLRTTFVFFASHEDDVLPTIVSRCQVVPVVKEQYPGFWMDASARALPEGEFAEVNSAVAGLTLATFADGSAKQAAKSVAGALEWAQQMTAMVSDSVPAHLLIDLALSAQLESVRGKAGTSPHTSLYLKGMMAAGEKAKDEINNWVSPKNAFESLALRLHQL